MIAGGLVVEMCCRLLEGSEWCVCVEKREETLEVGDGCLYGRQTGSCQRVTITRLPRQCLPLAHAAFHKHTATWQARDDRAAVTAGRAHCQCPGVTDTRAFWYAT